MKNRIERLNSLLREVISEVIFTEVKNPHVSTLVTVTEVDVSKDLRNARVYISVLGTEKEKKETLKALKSAAGFIGQAAAHKVVLKYFPQLSFVLDERIEQQLRVEELMKEIHDKESSH